MSHSSEIVGAPNFPVSTFKRVFDTNPVSEVLTLSELVACFRRFELKPQLHAKIAREIGRIDRALEQALAGAEPVGERLVTLSTAGAEARAAGRDPHAAMRAKAEELRMYAKKDAKKDLRLWSPAYYPERADVERGSEHSTHVSALVLDYDSGVQVSAARACFPEFFHLVHSTWSHTPEHPKFRLILPLAVTVPAASWEALWRWAETKSAGEIDPSMKGHAANYALPAVPSADAPRVALSHAAPLLDPRALGIDVGEPLRLLVRHAPNSMMLGDPDKEYVVHQSDDAVFVYDDPADDEWGQDWHDAPAEAAQPAPRIPPAPAAPPVKEARKARASAPAAKKSKGRRKSLCVDFDGVLHSYVSGWKGGTVLPDPPVPGAIAWLREAMERFDVFIFSTRTTSSGAVDAMRAYLIEHGLEERLAKKLRFPRAKPGAHVYLDDRGWRFEGVFPSLDEIDEFKPWNKRG